MCVCVFRVCVCICVHEADGDKKGGWRKRDRRREKERDPIISWKEGTPTKESTGRAVRNVERQRETFRDLFRARGKRQKRTHKTNTREQEQENRPDKKQTDSD